MPPQRDHLGDGPLGKHLPRHADAKLEHVPGQAEAEPIRAGRQNDSESIAIAFDCDDTSNPRLAFGHLASPGPAISSPCGEFGTKAGALVKANCAHNGQDDNRGWVA